MRKPVQWMTLRELRDEFERTRPAWETTDLDGFLADGQFPALSPDAQRHQEAMKDRSGWPIEALVDSQSSGDGRRRYVRVVLSVSSLGFTRPSLWTISTV
jgi:hypothetical protein